MTADHAGQTGGEREVCDPVSSCQGHHVVNEVADVTFWCTSNPRRLSIVGPEEPRPVPVAGQAAREAAVEAEWVHPDTIERQRAAGWPDMHPEDNCHRCGAPNPTWVADADLWQAATGAQGDEGGILCPGCFTALYERVTGRAALIWRVSIWGGRDAPLSAAGEQET